MAAAQNTPEWLRDRLGYATASRFADVISKGKGGQESRARFLYRSQLVVERLTGEISSEISSASLRWGKRYEHAARFRLEFEYGMVVNETGFMRHPEIKWCGASPDGLVANDGVVQIKCPHVSAIHLATLEDGIPSEHIPQIQGEMFVTGREWSAFVSYDPRMPEDLKLYFQIVKRDEEYLKSLEEELHIFLTEVDDMHQRMKKAGVEVRKNLLR